MDLPVERSKLITAIENQKFLIYGRPKIGKSTFCNEFPEPLFLATEPGLNHLECYKVIVNSWDKFLEAAGRIAEGKHKFKTIVIDTIDNLILYLNDEVCKDLGIEYIGDYKKFGAYHVVTSLLTEKINKLASLGYALVMTSHCKLVEVTSKTSKFNKYTITPGGKNAEWLKGFVDYILFIDSKMEKDEEVRIIRCRSSKFWDAGGRDKNIPEELPLDYKKLSSYFK